MARSKITKKIKLSRHRRRHRRNLTRSGGTPARRSQHTPHDAAQKFLERLRTSELKYYSLGSVAALAHTYSDSTNVPEKISNIVKKSSCGEAHTISELIKLASESGQISGTKQITESEINDIFYKYGLNKLTEPEILKLLKLCIKDFFGPCNQSGGQRKGSSSPRKPTGRQPPRSGYSWANTEIAINNINAREKNTRDYRRLNSGNNDEPECFTGILLVAGAFIIMMFLSSAGRFIGAP